jgi:hypothetical protein
VRLFSSPDWRETERSLLFSRSPQSDGLLGRVAARDPLCLSRQEVPGRRSAT